MTDATLRAAPLDPALPTLAAALDPHLATAAFGAVEAFAGASVRVASAALLRHKPGRRAVIAYELAIAGDGGVTRVHAIGKMRARRHPAHAWRLLRHLHTHGFDAASADGIDVPEPLGIARALGLWLQRRVDGVEATVALCGPDAEQLASRVAKAAVKLHRTPGQPRRVHTVDDEIAILARVLEITAGARPHWRRRLAALLAGGRTLAARVGSTPVATIHRDFYGDQVLLHGRRLTLLDFDLYCEGPAALDIGNFLGHLAEQALREPAHAPALARAEAALESAYVALAGEAQREAVRIFTVLTLARHVYLSHVVPGRLATADAVFDLAEARMEAARHVH